LSGLKKAGIDEGDSILFIVFFTSLSPVVSGETLLKGAVYFDPPGNFRESFAEFYFASRPEETYWTLAKFIVAYSLPRNWRHKMLNANELYEELFYRSPR
jgi:hypothetical protein